MGAPEIGEFAAGVGGEQALSMEVELVLVGEVGGLGLCLRGCVRQLTGQHGIYGQKCITKLRMLQQSIIIFVENQHEIVNIAPGCGFKIEDLGQPVVNLFH